jgi:hypothetical protein
MAVVVLVAVEVVLLYVVHLHLMMCPFVLTDRLEYHYFVSLEYVMDCVEKSCYMSMHQKFRRPNKTGGTAVV